MSNVPPIRREILVDADPPTAFEIFTDQIGRWWPTDEHGVFGPGATVDFTDGQIVESSPTGDTAVWGTVTRWDAPTAVAFTWHPGGSADRASLVEVVFEAVAAQTLVTLEHSGWEAAYDNPAGARAEYDEGWPPVLDRYRAAVAGATGDEPAQTWVALLHRPGPEAPADGSLFDDPRIGEHFAFLGRMQAAGYLVAAGPMLDAFGEGMTVLRLPGEDQLAEANRLATEDDVSVATGFLAVTIRPWQVMLHAGSG